MPVGLEGRPGTMADGERKNKFLYCYEVCAISEIDCGDSPLFFGLNEARWGNEQCVFFLKLYGNNKQNTSTTHDASLFFKKNLILISFF